MFDALKKLAAFAAATDGPAVTNTASNDVKQTRETSLPTHSSTQIRMPLTIPPVEAPFGVVDMGSNGIRFGIVQSLARHLPVLYEERAPISLFDAQSNDRRIPDETIDEVITSFLRFKAICDQAGVAPDNVRLIATEATRIAENSEEFQARILEATGWKTILLRKEEEALVSAMGIVG